jgi:hypothetical protein
MRIPLLLILVIACASCAVHQPTSQKPASPQSSFAYCSAPLRSESISGPLPPEAVPSGVALLATDRFKDDLKHAIPTGGWYQGSDGSYLFCSHRLGNPKACDSQRQFYRLNGGVWEPAEDDHLICK